MLGTQLPEQCRLQHSAPLETRCFSVTEGRRDTEDRESANAKIISYKMSVHALSVRIICVYDLQGCMKVTTDLTFSTGS